MHSLSYIQNLVNSEVKKEVGELRTVRPGNLYAPVVYVLEMGGKRLRPVLVLLSYNLFSDDIEKALPAALAIEVFHNFTLLHDDIMDNASVRRAKPTVHCKFGENAAILSGDVMSFISFRYLLKSETKYYREVLSLFAETAIEVCQGQQYDMDFETRLDVTEAEYLEMIRLKTAVLLACSLKSGALQAGADKTVASQLYEAGIKLGLAFQLQDDLLDSFGDEKTFGKKIGGDIISNKKTFLLIKALEIANAGQKEKLLYWLNKPNFDPNEKIEAVKAIYKEIGIKGLTSGKIESLFNKAETIFNMVKVETPKKSQLYELAQFLVKRDY